MRSRSRDRGFVGRVTLPAWVKCSRPLAGVAFAASVLLLPAVRAAAEGAGDLADLSIEELMDVQIEVTSVAKKPQALSEAAAAIAVLTGEDIRRAGVTSIPEALRLVPGVYVARVDANKWAVSSRGFDGRIANKLLVLVDGRCVYTPMFTGVLWEAQDTVLDDIDRIEVIRGPGGTLWGANAVNGVINIITKRAKDTQGGLLEAGAGSEERAFGAVRYGGRLGEDAYYRVYAKYFERDSFVDASGADTYDDWRARRSGFRIDWGVSSDSALTVQGDIYDGDARQTVLVAAAAPPFCQALNDEIDMSGGNLLVRWTRQLGPDSSLALQVYYDRGDRSEALFDATTETGDIDFQHRFPVGARHDVLWGIGVRSMSDTVLGRSGLLFDPPSATDQLYNAFIQDEIALVAGRLALTVGSKLEHNEYTGYEVQPSVRLAWTPTPRDTVWAAVSRAVRTPVRSERVLSFALPGTTEGLIPTFVGDPDFGAEELLAWEMGCRIDATDHVAFDLATFYNQYSNLGTNVAGFPYLDPTPWPHMVLPLDLGNDGEGETYGFELATEVALSDRWRLRGGYSLLKMDLEPTAGAPPNTTVRGDGQNPQQLAFLHSSVDVPGNVELDVTLRYVDAIAALDLDSYLELDVRLGWKPRPDLEVFIVGQNLLHHEHAEFRPLVIPTVATEVERGVYGGVTWYF
jgi:iron complex outermembrane receptor protein